MHARQANRRIGYGLAALSYSTSYKSARDVRRIQRQTSRKGSREFLGLFITCRAIRLTVSDMNDVDNARHRVGRGIRQYDLTV